MVYSDSLDLGLREKIQSYIPTERGYEAEPSINKAPEDKEIILLDEQKPFKSPEIIEGDNEYDPRKIEYDPDRIVEENDENRETIEYDPLSVKPLFDENSLYADNDPVMDEEEPKGQELDDVVQRLNNGFLFCQRFKLQIGKLQKKQNKKYFESFLRV